MGGQLVVLPLPVGDQDLGCVTGLVSQWTVCAACVEAAPGRDDEFTLVVGSTVSVCWQSAAHVPAHPPGRKFRVAFTG
jgi:hypothetical protein